MPLEATATNGDNNPAENYLFEAIDILTQWMKSGNMGLTTETFLACIQTMKGVLSLATYLHHTHGFKYLLTGKVMSDPLEARFGWYRQANGGNFFMSVKQLLFAEKKIRCLSLLQQNALCIATGAKPCVSEDMQASSAISPCNFMWLADFMKNVNLDEMPQGDADISYFVGGYIARSIVRRRKCSFYKGLLISKREAEDIKNCVAEEHKRLFEMADRGGLAEPTEYCYGVTALAVHYYSAIAANDAMLQKLLTFKNQRSVFVAAITHCTLSSQVLRKLTNVKCSAKHSNFDYIVQSSFNCFAKNLLKRLNSRPSLEEPEKKTRKMRKLTSKASKS